MRRLAVFGSALLLVGCGAAGPGTGDHGTVTGLVEFRACGGPPPRATAARCIFQPMRGAQVVLEVGGQTVKSAVTDTGGRYSVAVSAGTYTVRVVVAETAAVSDDSRTLKVELGQRVEADFQITFQAA